VCSKQFYYALVLIVAILMTGCMSKIKTPPEGLQEAPEGLPSIALNIEDIDCSGVSSSFEEFKASGNPNYHGLTSFRKSFQTKLYSSLIKKGNGMLVNRKDFPLSMFLIPRFNVEGISLLMTLGWAELTTFIPPLGLIPHSSNVDYQIDYTLHDDQGKVIYSNVLIDSVHGTWASVSLGVISVNNDLMEKETEFIAENCATLVINDIYKNLPPIIAAMQEQENAKQQAKLNKIAEEKKASENKRLAQKKNQKARNKQWIAIKKQAELALEINDFKKAVAIIEEARSLGVGGSDAEQMLKDIFRTPEWGAIKPKISIQKFDVSSNLDPSVGDFLYESLIVELTDSQRFTIVDWEELDRLLNYIAQSQPNLSFEDAKMHAMNQLGVNQLFVGSAYKIGSKIYVTVKALNLDLTVDTTYKDTAKTMDDLEACIARMADKFVFANNQ